MPYRLLLIICLILFYFLPDKLFAQKDVGFNGPVRKYSFYIYGPSSHFRAKNWQLKTESSYNVEGREINSGFWSKTNNVETLIDSTYTYYDDKGRRIKVVRRMPVDTGRVTYTYNSRNNLVETYYAYAGKGETFRIVYDKEKNTDTLYKNYKPNLEKITRHLNTYQDEEISYYRERVWMSTDESPNRPDTFPVPHRSLITFDKNRNKIDEKRYDPRGELEHHLTFTYNEYGNCIESQDSIWRQDEGSVEPKRKLHTVAVWKWLFKKYDKAGNWREQYTLIDGKFLLSARREFEYYD